MGERREREEATGDAFTVLRLGYGRTEVDC